MKTTWNHPAKQSALVSFVCICFVLLLFIGDNVAFPESFGWGEMGYLAFFISLAAFFGYRAFFCSDEWFYKKQDREKLDSAREKAEHPTRYFLTNLVLPFVLLALWMAYDIWHDFHKH